MPTTTKPPLETPNNAKHIPPVLSLAQETPNGTSPRIHILGDDLNSKYIAHAMSKMHEHVELMSWGGKKEKPRNVETFVQSATGKYSDKDRLVEPNGAQIGRGSDSAAHIDQLIITGYGRTAVPALETVKHRVDKNSTICLMNDGLGVLEDVRRRVFAGRREDEPHLVLGYMSHKIAYNRKHDSIKEMRQGRTMLTHAWGRSFEHELAAQELHQSIAAEDAFARNMESVAAFHSSLTGYHEWLRFKMPRIILGAVVEPTCVMFDSSYYGLLKNEAAFAIMNTLLEEILAVLDRMPELASSNVGNFIRTPMQRVQTLRSIIYSRKDQKSATLRLLDRGGYSDVNYLNGYFVARAQKLGIYLPRNTMTRDIVKGWHKRKIEERDQWIDVVETSVGIDQESRWNPFGQKSRWTEPRGRH